MKKLILLTDYRQNPIGLNTANPYFSWKYQTDAGAQLSYRVGVSSTQEKAEKQEYDLWDSGSVASARCTGIRYEGKPLSSLAQCYVRVTAECEKDVAESDIGTFETGLLEQSEWQGKWISVPVNFQGGTLRARKRFSLEKEVRRARVCVCGLGYHELYINGTKQGDAVLNPGVTAYDKRVLYCAYDIGSDLQKGDNVIGVELGYGWYCGRKLIAQVYVEYTDGTVYRDYTANGYGWWMGGAPVTENSIYGGEVYDARIESVYPLNWATADYEPTWENGWMYPLIVEAPGGVLEAQSIDEIRVCGTFPEIARTRISDTVTVIDVGQNLAGWARIRVRGERGAAVTLRYAEGLKEDGTVNQLNLRSARCSDTYILKGEGTEEWAPRFTYHGFRYVQTEISGKAELVSLTAEYVHSDVRPAGTFVCSDEALNRLHRNAAITETNNLHSIMTDCPQRDERFGWLNDLGSRLYQTVYNCGMERFFPKFAADITDTMDDHGGIADTVPYFTGGRPADPVSIAYLLIPLFSYRYYGDPSVILREYDGMKKWVDFLLSRSDHFIMNYSYYGDWVPPACFEDVATDRFYVSSAYLFWHLKLLAQIAAIAGKEEDAATYASLAESSRKAFNEKYFDASEKRYASGTQAENAIALSLGLCPPEYASAVAAHLEEDAVRHGHHSTCGNVGYRHFFYAMSDYGYTDEVLRILKNPAYPGWGYMLANGATTVWERWEAEMQNEMHSFNHPMYGSYDAWFYRYLAGIAVQEDAVGCDKIAIDPRYPETLSFVRATFETVRGTIESGWERTDGKIVLTVTVPPTVSAAIMAEGVCDGKPFAKGSVVGAGTWKIILN